jgi:hypothetical protein
MRRPRRTIRPLSILVAVLVLSAFGGVGFRVGLTHRTTQSGATNAWASAAAAAYSRANAGSYRLAWRASYHRGWKRGIESANAKATRAGRAAGRAEAAYRASAAHALATALASSPIRLSRPIKTDRCVPVAGGLCEALGPTVTGKPCPPASVPNPVGGAVCVPRVLLLAAQIADPRPAGRLAP